MPIVVEGRLRGHVKIAYNLENIRAQLEDNFPGVSSPPRRLRPRPRDHARHHPDATRPLDQLADGAAKVAKGRLDVTVPVDRDDEIGRLASTFDHMTERLRERQELELRLTLAEKRAEIGHLASGLAHEIKNPLNALSLGLDVLRRRHAPADPDSAVARRGADEALREEINRLAALINNFLAYGRPLHLTLAPTDLAAVVARTLKDLAETAEKATYVRRHASLARPSIPADASP